MRSVVDQFENYAKLNKRLPPETGIQLGRDRGAVDRSPTRSPPTSSVKVADKQALLGELDPARRLEMVFAFMEGELGVLQVEKKIRSRVKRQMEKTQREYYLNEQLKAIQRELGNEGEEGGDELAELAEKIAQDSSCRRKRATKANAELKKLKAMAPMSAEATVARNYLDVLLGLPWGKKSKLKKDIAEAQRDPRRGSLWPREGQGPDRRISRGPGAHQQAEGPDPVPRRPARRRQDLARPLDRPRDRAANSCASRLGGVRDEAEIRGHRRTYIGSLPGKIVTNLKKAGTSNPLFLLDEIDKLGQDFRGDPASALLEVLDPEQNSKFQDHYLEIDYDLSDVMFVTTANSLEHAAAAARPHGDHPARRLHRGREGRDRQAPPDPQADRSARPEGRASSSSPTSGAARADPLLHPRGGRAHARARDRQGRAQGRCARSSRARPSSVELTPDNLGDYRRRAQVPPRHGRGRGPDRRRHRPRLDRGRRRAADDRGGHRPRQGPDQDHRQARRSDAGIDPGGDELRQGARARLRRQAVHLRAQGHPRPPARRRGAQGRAVGRHRHGHRDRSRR